MHEDTILTGFAPPFPPTNTTEDGISREAKIQSQLTIPSFVCRNHSEIFSLGFSALSDAARNSTLELMRTADTAVPVLQLHSQADRITNAVSAPYAMKEGQR